MINDIKKSLVTAFAGAAIGMFGLIGFWLSPLKAMVMHRIWNESAILRVHTSQRALRVGDQMEVFVEVVPDSPIPLSGGVLHISPSDEGLVAKSGLTSSATPEIAAPMILPQNERPVLQAMTRGRSTITATLQTKFGNYTATASVDISPINEPTKENFSGEWHLRLGRSLGKMELIHRDADISGIYSFTQPIIKGAIAGFVDGDTFTADFVHHGETRRKQLVQGIYKQVDGFVVIEGKLTQQIMKNNDWTQAGSAEEFYATSALRRQSLLVAPKK